MRLLKSYKSPIVYSALFALILPLMIQNLSAQTLKDVEIEQETASTKPFKIAYVNIQEVIVKCAEGKNESVLFQRWVENKQADLQNIQNELNDLKDKLKVQGDKLTENARFELEDSVEAKNTLLQRTQQDLQKEADKRQLRISNTIYQKTLPIIEKIAEDKELDVVHFYNADRDAFVRPSLFITDEVIKAYDLKYPVGKTTKS